MHDRWDDTYNSVLIQELLSRTPFAGGLSLSPEELMDYRTGAWYFASREPRNISIAINNSQTPQEKEELRKKYEELNSQGFSPGIVYETEETVTLWDILPQHYYNNYIIAVVIFLSGWIGGFLLLAAHCPVLPAAFSVYSENPGKSGLMHSLCLRTDSFMADDPLYSGKFRFPVLRISQSSSSFRRKNQYGI